MALFPSGPRLKYPLTIESSYRTLVSNFETGEEQRRKLWAFPKRRVQLAYDAITQSDMDELWEFYCARSGAYESFYFYFPYMEYWYGEYLGTGPGEIFELKSKNTDTATTTVYVDGGSVGYDFLEGGGQYSSDRIDLTVAAAEGEVVSADFYGEMRLKCRFEEDKLSKEIFSWLFYNNAITLIEVKSNS